MKNLTQLLEAVLLSFLTFAYYGAKRGHRLPEPECGRAPRALADVPEPPDEEWCPAHDAWYGARTECPGCREEWEQTWTLGEDPEDLARRDDWVDQMAEAAAADECDAEVSDLWYRDVIARASFPHAGWRDSQ